MVMYFKSYASVSKIPIHDQLIVEITFVPDGYDDLHNYENEFTKFMWFVLW